MDDSKFFILGANGQLGKALQAQYPNAQKADSDGLDITSRDAVLNYDWSKVGVVLNAAAYTNVDGAESAEGRIAAWKVNATAVSYLAEAARQHNLTLVHFSSDYVFDGTKDSHTETEELAPLSVYGASKAAGDLAAASAPRYYVLRTSWVIGEGKNFVRTMLGVAQKGISPTVVADQIGRLTFTSELVRAIDHLLSSNARPGVYNLTNDGDSVSWADVTRKIFEFAGFKDLEVTDTTTAEYFAGKEGIAPRPLKSTLDLSKIHKAGFKSNNWQDDLKTYIAKEKEQAA
jgi:dTDP-4-dehydrorhamnose 3,5-epimerase/reductase